MKKRTHGKKIKRLLAMLCIAALLGNVCSMQVDAHYSTDVRYMQIPSLTFELLSDDQVRLCKYQKEMNQEPYVLGIPSGINVEARDNTQRVIGIDNNVFINEQFSMIYVETNNGMEIGKYAFNKVRVNHTNSYVTDMDVNFLGGKKKGPITDIGEYAFAYFYVPGGYVHIDNVTGKIGAHAFEQASILESFDIADGLIEEIGESAFRSFHASSFHIPDYKKVDACAFSRANFKTFQLSDKVESIGSRIFEGCDALEEITLPAENHIKEVSADAFPDNKGLRINVPAGYEDLSAYHFDQYQNLTFCLSPKYTTESEVYKQLAATGAEVVIQSFVAATTTDSKTTTTQATTTEPEATTTQAATTEPEATTTQATTTEPETTTMQAATTESEASAGKTTGSDTSSQSSTVTNVSVITNVASSASASASADKGKKSGKKTSVVGTMLTRKGISYQITGKNTAVCIGAASPKKKVTVAASITYKGKSYLVTELGTKAFYMDKTLEYLKLGKNVKKIRSSALERCTKLKRVTFGRNLTTIEKRAFYKDKNLIRLIFDGEKLRTVGKRAFSKGKKSKKVIVPSTADQKRYYKLLQGSIVD